MLTKLNNIIQTFNNLLLILVVTTFTMMIGIKAKAFQSGKQLRIYESQIASLEVESEMLKSQLAYLTTPQRLANLYNTLKEQQNYFQNTNIVTKQQINDLNALFPYYLSKTESRNGLKKGFAQK